MTERDEIQKLLKANAGTIADNLAEFFIRNVEDLAASGVSNAALAETSLTVAVSLLIKQIGIDEAVAELRRMADGTARVSARLKKCVGREARH